MAPSTAKRAFSILCRILYSSVVSNVYLTVYDFRGFVLFVHFDMYLELRRMESSNGIQAFPAASAFESLPPSVLAPAIFLNTTCISVVEIAQLLVGMCRAYNTHCFTHVQSTKQLQIN